MRHELQEARLGVEKYPSGQALQLVALASLYLSAPQRVQLRQVENCPAMHALQASSRPAAVGKLGIVEVSDMGVASYFKGLRLHPQKLTVPEPL